MKKLQHLEFAGFVNQFRVFFRKALRDLQGCPEGGDLVDLVDAIHWEYVIQLPILEETAMQV